MKLECPNCGSDYPDLPIDVTEHQARLALRAVMLWFGESPIREIQMANAMCGMHFPIEQIKAALTASTSTEPKWVTDYEKQLTSDDGPSVGPVKEH